VEHQNIPVKEIFGKGSLDSRPFQKGIGKDPGAKSVPVGFLQQVRLFKIDMFPGDGKGKFPRLVGKICPEILWGAFE
jgi:hypothetical protein